MTAPLGDFIRQKWVDLNDGISLFRSRILAGTLTSNRTITTPDRSGVLVTMPTDLVSVANAGKVLRVNAAGTDTEAVSFAATIPAYTVAALPSTDLVGANAFVTDEYGGPTAASFNGRYWQRAIDSRICKGLGWPSLTPIAWTQRNPPTDNNWLEVYWAKDIRLLVAISNTGANDRVMTSRDGVTWLTGTVPVANNWRCICYSLRLNLFVALSNTGTGNRVMTSKDGFTWTIGVTPAVAGDIDWRSICYSESLGLFAACALGASGSRIMTSPDGFNWTMNAAPTPGINNYRVIIRIESLNLFVAAAATAAGGDVITSEDGKTWALVLSNSPNCSPFALAYSPQLKRIVMLSDTTPAANSRAMWSDDKGVTWTIATTPGDCQWRSCAYSDELGIFVGTAYNGVGADRSMYSADGKTWTLLPVPASNSYVSTIWVPELRKFVCVANTGTGNRAMTLG
jgi:hypothetical protein